METQDPWHLPGDGGRSPISLETPIMRGDARGSGTGTPGWHRVGAEPARGTPGSRNRLLLTFRLLGIIAGVSCQNTTQLRTRSSWLFSDCARGWPKVGGIIPSTILLARTKRSQDAKPATYLMSPSPAPSPGTGDAAGARPPLLHPFPQLALLGGPHPSPEGHLPQLLHPLPVPGLQALQPPALQEALLGGLLALLQDLLLVLQLRAYPAPGGGLRRSCGGGGTQPS